MTRRGKEPWHHLCHGGKSSLDQVGLERRWLLGEISSCPVCGAEKPPYPQIDPTLLDEKDKK